MSVLPMVIGGPWWIGAPVRRRQWSHAWGRVQQLTMVGSWILLNLMCLFKPVLLIGYWYTLDDHGRNCVGSGDIQGTTGTRSMGCNRTS